MHRLLRTWIATALLLVCGSVGFGQNPPPPPQPPAPAEKQPDTPKAAEAKKYDRDGSTIALSYTLALIGVIIVMVLVCMPARRE